MESEDELKETDIKNYTCYYFDDILRVLCQKVNLERIYIIEQSNSELRVNFMNRTIVK